MTTITIRRPATVAEPRGARWAAQAAGSLLDALRRVQHYRSARRAAANRLDEAAAVRRLAVSWQDVDPRFSADLFAAADRHESR
jgi:hypothetical protein